MAVKHLAGERLIGTAAERAALTTSASGIAQTSWKLLARDKLTSAGDVLDTANDSSFSGNNFAPKDNLMILIIGYKSGNAQIEDMTFNGDTDDNYSARYSENGGDDAQHTQDSIQFGIDSEDDEFAVIQVKNLADEVKLLAGSTSVRGATGNNAIGNRLQVAGKWVSDPLSQRITRVTITNAPHTGDLDTDSEIIVLGCDDDETATTGASASPTHTDTNFWQELATADVTGDNHTVSIAAKKYLMISTAVVTTGGTVSQRMTFNDTASGGYAQRKSFDGATDDTSLQSANIDGVNDDLVTNSIGFATYYGVNVTNKEKLFVARSNSAEAVGTAPTRDEVTFKWTSSAQIIKIDFDNNKTGDWAAGSNIRVWGSD
jgi:hypothetical protein